MKRAVLILLGVALGGLAARPQTKTNDAVMDEARRILWQTMDDYARNPKAASRVKSGPVIPAKTPAVFPPARTSAPPAAAAAPAPAPPSGAAAEPSFEFMEQMYLDGKITAKQFQKYLMDRKVRLSKGTNAPATATASPAPAPKAAPAPTAPPAEPAVPAAVSDVEKRLEALERAQAARLKAATNTVSTTPGPKTKRQRLDELLKQFVDGTISEEDYKTRRAKILEEPD